MSGLSGKNKQEKNSSNLQLGHNGFEAFVAKHICDADACIWCESPQSESGSLSYDLLLTVLGSSPMAVALFSEDLFPLYWNQKFSSYFGSMEEDAAQCFMDKKGNLWRCVGKSVCTVKETKGEFSSECCKLSEHGTYEWFETQTKIIKAGNTTPFFLFVATDITHQKTAQISLKQTRDELEERVKERTTILAKLNNTLEEQIERSQRQQQALKESEEQFRNLFLNEYGVRFFWDASSFEIVEANIGAADFYGYELDLMAGQQLQAVTGMSLSSVQDRIEEVKRSGHVSFTALHRLHDETMRYVEVHFVLAKNKGRKLIYTVVADISERIEAERKAHEHQNNLKALMNATSDCALLVDPDGLIITMNHAAGEEFKCTGQPSRSVNLFSMLNDKVVSAWRGAFDAVLVMGMAEHIETDVNRCWTVSFYPVFTESLDISAVAIYAEDVTFEKRTSEQMKLLSKRVLSAQEDERKRIGRELHDSTAQTISGIKYLLESEVALMERGGQVSPQKLEKMIELLQGAIVELRHIIMALRPTILDDLGLISALRWLLNETSIMHPAFSFTGTFELSEQVFSELQKTVLFRVAQEAISNAAKHSQGSSVSLHIKQEAESCVLYVQDDGDGFSVETCSRDGVGLGSMRERIELANGTLDILSYTGQGTLVRAAVPLCSVKAK